MSFLPDRYISDEDRGRLERILLKNLRDRLPVMQDLLARVNDQWSYEDGMYRFYYHSFKVFHLQEATSEIVDLLKALAPEGRELSRLFLDIVAAGTGRQFVLEDNQHWPERTAPITQAFLHAKYSLEMAMKYADLPEAPQILPSGWAAILCLYDLR